MAWLLENAPPGAVLPARVTHLESFGAFVDLGCGVTSLIPLENISVARIPHPGVRFRVDQDILAAVTAGELYADAPVEAVEPGAAGNVGAGAVVYMAQPPVRIVACANVEPFTQGLDTEGDEELRERISGLLRQHLQLMAEEVEQLSARLRYQFQRLGAAVTVLPKSRGVGTVDIVPAAQGGVPSQALLGELQDYFDQVREIAVDVRVEAPAVETVDLSLKLWAAEGRDFAAVAGAVEDALRAWFNGERLGRPLPRAQITSLVFGVDGVANCEILSPAADLPLDNVTLPVLGELAIADGTAPEPEPEPSPESGVEA